MSDANKGDKVGGVQGEMEDPLLFTPYISIYLSFIFILSVFHAIHRT